jgi:hypothetical protein
MSKTVFEPSILSRPVYGELEPRTGQAHLMVADGEGALALLDCVARAADILGLLARTHVIYCPGPNGTDLSDRLAETRPAQLHRAPSFAAALPRLRRVLADARMGTQVYLAGSEGLIGQVPPPVERFQ